MRFFVFSSALLFAGCFLDVRFKGHPDASVVADMAMDHAVTDMAAAGDLSTAPTPANADMANAPPCDPKGMTGPQCQWRWQTPHPQGDDLLSAYAFGDNDVFAINGGGLIIHRDASGWAATATQPQPGSFLPSGLIGCGTLDLYAFGRVAAASSTYSTAVFHSIDKGLTWVNEYTGTASAGAPSLLAGACLNGYTLFVGEKQLVLSRGTTGFYSVMTSPNSTTDSLTGVVMTSTLDVVTSQHATYSSPHLSYTWSSGTLPSGPTYSFNGLCLGGGSRYWAVGSQTVMNAGPTILTATDGKTWTAQAAPSGFASGGFFKSCIAADATHAVTVGASNFGAGVDTAGVAITQNGTSWSQPNAIAPSGLRLLAVALPTSGSVLTAVGEAGALWRSTDNGNTWISELKGDAPSINAMGSPGGKVVFAAGSAGAIYKTVDDGTTWTKLTTNLSNSLTGVLALSATDVFIVGSGNTILHSTDGSTFTQYANAAAPIPSSSDFTGISGAASAIYAVASTSVLRTTDDGASWHVVPITGISQPQSLYVHGPDIFVGDSTGAFFHSSDGSTWSKQAPAASATLPIVDIKGRANGQVFAIANDQQGPPAFLSLASPSGTWPATAATGAPSGLTLAVTPTQIFWSGSLSRSTDDGATFSPLLTGISQPRAQEGAIFPLADNDIFVCLPSAFQGGPGIIHYGN